MSASTDLYRCQFPTREPRPKLWYGSGWRALLQALKPGQQPVPQRERDEKAKTT